MKFYFTALLIPFFLFSCGNDKKSKTVSATETTYLLIRHAEKDKSDPTNRNPILNRKGLDRSINWSQYFENYDIEMVFSTAYNRTQQTATPTAVSKDLKVLTYNPSSLYDDAFKAQTKGKTVLIVGHSNTTPDFVNAILGEEKYGYIDEFENGLLYKVIVTDDGATATEEKITF